MGLSLGRYRVSSLAFAPGTEKQVQMQCTRVSEQLPKRRNQTVSKAVGGRRAGTQEREVVVGGGGVPRVGAGRGEGEVKGTLSVGDARPWAGMRGKWGMPGLAGCLEWASGRGAGRGKGSRVPPGGQHWALRDPGRAGRGMPGLGVCLGWRSGWGVVWGTRPMGDAGRSPPLGGLG